MPTCAFNIALVALHQLEVTLSEPVKVVEGNLLGGGGFDSKVLEGQGPFGAGVGVIFLLGLGGNVVLGPKVGQIGGEGGRRDGRLPKLRDLAKGFGRRAGDVGEHGLLARNVVHELGQLTVGEIAGAEAVDGPALELFGLVDDAGDDVRDVGHVHRLGEGVAAVDHWDEGGPGGRVGEKVQKPVLRAEELGGTNDSHPGVRFPDGHLPLKLGPRPLGLGVGGGGKGGDVDEVVHLELRAELGDLAGDVDVGLLEGEVGLRSDERELVGGGEALGLVVLSDQVDDDVGVGDDLGHGVAVVGAVIDVAGTAQVEHGAEVPQLELVATLPDVGEDSVGPEVAAHVPAKEPPGPEHRHLHSSVGCPAAGPLLSISSLRDPVDYRRRTTRRKGAQGCPRERPADQSGRFQHGWGGTSVNILYIMGWGGGAPVPCTVAGYQEVCILGVASSMHTLESSMQ